MPLASIIIPTKDREPILHQNLDHLQKALAGKEIEVIVVNDGSRSVNISDSPFAQLFQNPGSGVAAARNFGASKASSERLIFLDDDMLIFPENIDRILSLTRDVPDCCINLNWVYPPALQEQISKTSFGRYLIHYGFTTLKGWNRGNEWNEAALFNTTGITSQFLYISKNAFRKVGGYTETYPFAGFEDYDLAQKLRRQQISFYIDPLSTCWHNELDRLTPKQWLERKKRGAVTRKHAVKIGHKELVLHYPLPKSILYLLCTLIKPLLFLILSIIPNLKSFDFIYFSLTNLLLGTDVYEGYRKS